MKKFLVAVAVIAIFAGMAMASETRLEGLGLNGSVTAPDGWMVADDANVKLFPASVVKYPKLAVFEYDGSDLDSYVNMEAFGGVLGVYANYTFMEMVTGLSENAGVLYGMNLSDTMSLGFGLSYAQQDSKTVENKTEVPETTDMNIAVDYFENVIGVSAGLSLLGDMPMDFGLAVAVPLNVSEEDTSYDVDKKKTAFYQEKEAGIEGRLHGKVTMGDVAVGLGVQYVSSKYEETNQTFDTSGTKTYDGYDTNDSTYTLAQLGVVKSVKLEKVLVFAGTQVEMFLNSYKDAAGVDKVVDSKPTNVYYYDSSEFTVPVIIGAEAKINDNWTVRAGAKKSIWNSYTSIWKNKNVDGKITSISDTYTSSYTDDLNMNMGATFEMGAASIDLLVDKDLVLAGPNFVSGASNDWSSKVALNIKW